MSRIGPWLCGGVLALASTICFAQSNPFPTPLIDSSGKFTSVAAHVQPLVYASDSPTDTYTRGSSVFDKFVPYPISSDSGRLFTDLPNLTADSVIRFNACGRELDYALLRNLLANASLADQDRYSQEGSELTSMLLAKIVWLSNKATASMSCVATMVLRSDAPLDPPQPSNPPASYPHSYVDAVAQLLQVSPTACTGVSASSPGLGSTPDPPIYGLQPQGPGRGIQVVVTPECMRQQVNDAILAMQKKGNLGTTGVPCGLDPISLAGGLLTNSIGVTTDGDWDPNNRELVRILYLGTQTLQRSTQFVHGPILDPATVRHMELDGLLAAAGAVGPDTYPIPLSSCSNYAGDQQGGAADIEDQGNFASTLAKDLGNDLEWLIDLIIDIEIGGELGVLDSVLPLVLTPYLVVADSGPLGILPIPSIPYQETENHRIQIETSRFLTNAYYINELAQDNQDHDSLDADQRGVTAWLQQKMQSVAFGDFLEYNAKNYGTYSLQSLLNLYDFAADSSMQVGAHSLLDLSEAKFAAGSSVGRRIVPFRRHDYEDGYSPTSGNNQCGDQSYLYHSDCSEDQEVLRSMALVGQTQLMSLNPDPSFSTSYCPTKSNPRCIDSKAMPSLLNTDISSYALPEFLRQVIIQRPASLTQHIKHAGVESYYQEHSFTVSEGGIRTPELYPILGLGSSAARGDAMPAVIIPTMGGVTVSDAFSFNGSGLGGDRTNNLCMYKGFICGLNPNQSQFLVKCGAIQTQANGSWVADSAHCSTGVFGNTAVVVVGWTFACKSAFCGGESYGFMDATDCSRPAFAGTAGGAVAREACDPIASERLSAANAVTFDATGTATYVNHYGDRIRFQIRAGAAGPVILDVNGNALPTLGTVGDILNSDGAGHAVIQSPVPGSSHISIDYSDKANPTWQIAP